MKPLTTQRPLDSSSPSYRICTPCGEAKPSSEFYRDRRSRSGLATICKACNLAKAKRWREQHPDRALALYRRYREEHRSARAEYMARWRRGNKASKLEYDLRWQREHPEHVRMRNNQARAQRKGATDTLTLKEWLGLLEHWGYRCAYCGTDGLLEMEHVKPISAGGANAKANVVPACHDCNVKKGRGSLPFRPGAQ